MIEYKVLFWCFYAIGVFAALLLFADDAYEESWKRGMLPEQYFADGDVVRRIILYSMGSWVAIFLRWKKNL